MFYIRIKLKFLSIKVLIWDLNMIRDSKPLHVFKEHNAAIKGNYFFH
jgi:hypothetical protein